MSAYAKLRRKRQIFVDAYVRTGIGRHAALEAGYGGKRPDAAASKMLANPEVKAAVVERQEEAIAAAGVRAVKVLEEAALMGYARVLMLRGKNGEPLSFKEMPDELLAGAQSIEFHPDGKVKNLRLAKADGLNFLGKYLKLLTELHEHSGKDGGPIETKEVSDLEVARRIAFLLGQGLRAARPASVLSDPNSTEGAPDSGGDAG